MGNQKRGAGERTAYTQSFSGSPTIQYNNEVETLC